MSPPSRRPSIWTLRPWSNDPAENETACLALRAQRMAGSCDQRNRSSGKWFGRPGGPLPGLRFRARARSVMAASPPAATGRLHSGGGLDPGPVAAQHARFHPSGFGLGAGNDRRDDCLRFPAGPGCKGFRTEGPGTCVDSLQDSDLTRLGWRVDSTRGPKSGGG